MGLVKIKTINSEYAVLFLGLISLGCEGGVELAKPQENPVQPTQETPNQNNFFRAKCVGVIDGDTVDILTPDKKQFRLRLASIDAPERGQPFGTTAKKFLSDLIFGKEISY